MNLSADDRDSGSADSIRDYLSPDSPILAWLRRLDHPRVTIDERSLVEVLGDALVMYEVTGPPRVLYAAAVLAGTD